MNEELLKQRISVIRFDAFNYDRNETLNIPDGKLIEIAEEITKVKTNVRTRALAVLGAAIEMLYKTYFITNKIAFAEKLPKFLEAYDSISQNGHIKLHLIADLC